MKFLIKDDQPITSKADDKYARKTYAQRIAKVLIDNAGDGCHAIGIQGRWGSGKTSLKNMVMEELREVKGAAGNLKHLEFNPWTLGGSQHLAKHLFEVLSASLPTKNKALREKISTCAHLMGYAELLMPQTKFIENTKKALDKVLHDTASTHFDGIIKEISDELRKTETKFIIILDDIDRLIDDEIIEVFRLVKGMSNIHGITFLLLYDRAHIANALQKVSLNKGEEFLGKIVQFPINVPEPPTDSIISFVEHEVMKLTQNTDANLSQANSRFRAIWNENIAHYLSDPRRATRYVNSLAFQIEGLMDKDPAGLTRTLEANLFDLITLECIRLFEPKAYDRIYPLRDELLGTHDQSVGNIENQMQKRAREDVIKNVPQESARHARAMVEYLFPVRSSLLAIINDELKENRVSNQDTFGRYFYFSVEPTDTSRTDIRLLNEAIFTPEKLTEECEKLKRAKKKRYLQSFLKSFKVDQGNLANVVSAFSHLFDAHTTEDTAVLDDDVAYFVNKVLRWSHETKAKSEEEVVQMIIEYKGARVTLAAAELLNQTNYFDALKNATCSRTKELAHAGELLKIPKAHLLISFWNKHSPAETKKWTTKIVQNPHALTAIIEGYKTTRTYNGESEPALMYDYLASAFPVDGIYKTLKSNKRLLAKNASKYVKLFAENFECQTATNYRHANKAEL
jgi:hypothetical protein